MELNYQTMVEDMNVGILLQDAEGEVISANRKAAEIFNTTLEELYSRKSISMLGETGKVQRNTVCNIELPGGKYRTLLCNSQPIFDQPEFPAQAVVSTFQDITREKEFERVAKDREALFLAFMDHSPFFSWIVDKEDNLQYANKSLLEYFQVNESAYGKKLAEIIPGPLACIIREKHLALQSKKEDRSIVKFRLDDGEEHVYQVVVFPIHGAAPDSLVGGGALDITESYRARQEEKRVTEQLREMEALLAKQKLKEQKGIAEAIIKAQEDERTRIGHELHDNINQILASGQLYLTVLTKDIEDFQEIKEKTLEIMQLAIEEVRVLSKGLVLPDLKKGGLVASIDDLVLDLRVGDLFEVEFTHSPTGQLEQMSQSKKVTLFRIVQEQTKNIIKYSKAKLVKIDLHLDIDRVRLEISDDGQGFDPANTRKGLGLSNIFERSRLYDGNAILGTAPGKGCRIIVNIPFGCHPAIR
jgi:PAS domain S-box-containing protein